MWLPLGNEAESVVKGGCDGETRGSNARIKDCRVLGETPASVKSPKAPVKSPKPCFNITIDTKTPDRRPSISFRAWHANNVSYLQ